MTSSQTYYEILGVASTASVPQIESAYRQLALQLHPDKTGIQNDNRFLQLSEIKSILTDSEKRKVYDLCLKKIPKLENQSRKEKVLSFAKLFRWIQPESQRFNLVRCSEPEQILLSLTRKELDQVEVSTTRVGGCKLPIAALIKKKLEHCLLKYVDDHFVELEVANK